MITLVVFKPDTCIDEMNMVQNEMKAHSEPEKGKLFVSMLIVEDGCNRVGAEGEQTSCLSCEIEEDQSVSGS